LHKALSRHAILITPVDRNVCTYRLLPHSASAFPESWAGQRPHLYFRGLLKVHSRYGLPVCSHSKSVLLSPELQPGGLPVRLSG